MKREQRFYQPRLAKQLLFYFGVALLLAGSSTLGLDYYLRQVHIEREIQIEASSITRSLQIIANTDEDSDYIEELEQVVEDSIKLPGVIEVIILDANEKELAHAHREQLVHSYEELHSYLKPMITKARTVGTESYVKITLHGRPTLIHLLPFHRDGNSTAHPSGFAVSVLDLQAIQQATRQGLLISTVTMLGTATGVLVVMGLLLKKTVLRPLTQLTRKVASSKDNGHFEMPRGLPNNEIRLLAETFDRVFQERQQAEQKLQQSTARLRNQAVILTRLARQRSIGEGNLHAAVQEINEATAETLKVERVSIWLYNEDRTQLECIDLLVHNLIQPALKRHHTAASLIVEDYPVYFRAIETTDKPIAAEYVQNDPRTCEFTAVYLAPLDIQSMLDVPIRISGQTAGVVCIEQVGQTRSWTPEDENFARSIGDLVALSVEAYERRQAEQQIVQQSQDLERALNELQRTQAQVIQSEKMSSLGQMVAGVAHEINNPVNFIYGNINHANQDVQTLIDLLKLYQRYYPDPVPEICATAEDIDLDFIAEDLPNIILSMRVGAERIREIVRSLRTFSRLDEAEYKTANVHDGLDSTLMILHHRLKAKPDQREIKIIKDYGDIPEIECYPGQLNQVFMNILSNAIDALEDKKRDCHSKYNKSDKVEHSSKINTKDRETDDWIQIRTARIGKDWVQICIADSGLGMSEAVLSKLFDPFFTTKPVGKGTGLGLSISYQIIVERHSGILKCHSALGQGSEFVIELPIWGACVLKS